MNKAGNPLAVGLVIVGALAMAVAAFLPLDEPAGPFHMVSENTLIQHDGWLLIAIAVGIAISGYWASQRQSGAWWLLPVILCVVAALGIAAWATDKDMRTLYPEGPDGQLDTSHPTVVSLGIAVYVAGAGVALALIGSLMLGQRAKQPVPDDRLVAAWAEPATKKKCPDCAETILADAKVCRYCGHHFPTKNVRCFNCNHVQAVLVSQTAWRCEECNQLLQLR